MTAWQSQKLPQPLFLLTRPSRDVTYGMRLLHSQHLQFLLTRPSRDVTGTAVAYLELDTFLLTRPSRDVTVTNGSFRFVLIFLLTRPSRDVTSW